MTLLVEANQAFIGRCSFLRSLCLEFLINEELLFSDNMKIKVKSKSDVITNSSSEVFCTITTDKGPEKLKEIYNALNTMISCSACGDGGVELCDDERIVIEFGYDVESSGIMDLAIYGFNRFMEQFDGEYTIKFNEDED